MLLFTLAYLGVGQENSTFVLTVDTDEESRLVQHLSRVVESEYLLVAC
jgi:hypothetical protein